MKGRPPSVLMLPTSPDAQRRLNVLKRHDPACYIEPTNAGIYVCSRGHRFTTTRNTKKCLTCAALEHAPATFICDQRCLNYGPAALLRLKCLGHRHNPLCAREHLGGQCSNIIYCGQEFYATADRLRYSKCIYRCDLLHNWPSTANPEVISCMRVFEQCFGARFDECALPPGLLGYNAELNIGFAHVHTIQSTYHITHNPNTDAAKIWCASRNAHLVVIPAEVISTASIRAWVVHDLFAADLLPPHVVATPAEYIIYLKKKMRATASAPWNLFAELGLFAAGN